MPKKTSFKLKDIDLIVYDFDGVMTDNRVLVYENGKEAVFCNRSDGLAIQKIKKLKIPQIILTTEKNNVVKVRAEKLSIKVIDNVHNKKIILTEYCKMNNYKFKKVIYIGNDINDLEAMKAVGYPIAPKNANIAVKKIAKLILSTKGGDGVVRELYDRLIM
jgi:YrbI family 3-deoxy-D-manno-octulosonate 8-phosphate phosphatase